MSTSAQAHSSTTAAPSRTRDGSRARFVGVFETLCQQHAEAADLLARVLADPSQRAAIWPTLRAKLISHETGELAEVYPLLRQHPETAALADSHDADAGDLRATIERLHGLSYEAAEWGPLFAMLVELVQRHVEAEEHSIFPQAQEVLGDARAMEVEVLFLDCQTKTLEQV